jgi:hypothetical protein
MNGLRGCLREIFFWSNVSSMERVRYRGSKRKLVEFVCEQNRLFGGKNEKSFDSLDPGTEYAFYAWSGIETSRGAGCCEGRPYASLPPPLSSGLLSSRTPVLPVCLPIKILRVANRDGPREYREGHFFWTGKLFTQWRCGRFRRRIVGRGWLLRRGLRRCRAGYKESLRCQV